jgi:hypothetical protein
MAMKPRRLRLLVLSAVAIVYSAAMPQSGHAWQTVAPFYNWDLVAWEVRTALEPGQQQLVHEPLGLPGA